MKKEYIVPIIFVVAFFVSLFLIGKAINRNKEQYRSSIEEIRLEQNKLYLRIDSLEEANDKLDSIYYVYKTRELIKNTEYEYLKAQYNILKHENKNKNTPIKQFSVAQLDSFWNSGTWAK